MHRGHHRYTSQWQDSDWKPVVHKTRSHLMSRIFLKILSLVFLVTQLAGCMGAGVYYPENSTAIINPKIGIGIGEYRINETGEPDSCSQALTHWGNPNETMVKENDTHLRYDHGPTWLGIMAIIVFPIPIAIPVGKKHTTLICRNGFVIEAKRSFTAQHAFYCGVISAQPEYGCRAE